jgi:tRNA threonylcarbamoyladenosine biosynthesis protein TsaB
VSQSNLLLDQIGEGLDEAGIALRDVEFFAVACGPGSFTGIRIGIATVKSFAATLGRNTIGIQTLHAIAYGAGESPCTIASIPAGRGELYAQRLSVSNSGAVTPLSSAVHVAPAALLHEASATRKLAWAGEGARIHLEEIKARAQAEGIPFGMTENQTPRTNDSEQWTIVTGPSTLAVSIARMAVSRVNADAVCLPEELRAIYVRPSDAEMTRPC